MGQFDTWNLISFFLGGLVGFSIFWCVNSISGAMPTQIKPQEKIVVITNYVERTSSNVNWFKDNSNYIWDGWKIK